MRAPEFKYPYKPINKIESLSKHLGFECSELQKIAKDSDEYYRPLEKQKKNGGNRTCYSVADPLKTIHLRIRQKILLKVAFPQYLHGSIKCRSPKTNAQMHIGANTVIQLDIAEFFPSIDRKHVYQIFRKFFHFSAEVSNLLADLITYRGQLPQGSPLSSDIANFVLCWDGAENRLKEKFKGMNLTYTRYVDDISISSNHTLTNAKKTEVVCLVINFVKAKGFRIRHKKTSISGPKIPNILTGVRVGKNKIDVSRKYIDSVYFDIKQLNFTNSDCEQKVRSLTGKINHINQFNPKQALRLHEFLERSKSIKLICSDV